MKTFLFNFALVCALALVAAVLWVASATPITAPTGSAHLAAPLPATSTSPSPLTVPTVAPSIIPANLSTNVTFTIPIADATLIPNSVNLIQVNGSSTTILGQFHDDGLNGDAIAGDHVYTIIEPLSLPSGQIDLEVSAAFRGMLRRVLSPIVQIGIWNVVTDNVTGFSALVPPSLYNVTDPNAPLGTYYLASSPQGVAIGGEAPEDGSNATTSGFLVTISATSYPEPFDIDTWLTSTNSDVGTLSTRMVGGSRGFEITFVNQVGAGRPTVVIYHDAYLYQVSYASTFPIGSADDENGLAAFNSVLSNFAFLLR